MRPLPMSVLVVEPCLLARRRICHVILRLPEFQLAAEASSAENAMNLFLTLRPDVVLLAVRLPDASGFEVLERLRQMSPDCSIMIISASPDSLLQEASVRLGAAAIWSARNGTGHLVRILYMLLAQARTKLFRTESNLPQTHD